MKGFILPLFPVTKAGPESIPRFSTAAIDEIEEIILTSLIT